MGKYKELRRLSDEEIKDISNKLGITEDTLRKRQFREGFFEWVEDALWLASVGLHSRCRIYRNGNERCAVPVVRECIGVSRESAEKRLELWEDDLFDMDDVMRPGPIPKTERCAPEWAGLTSTDRSCNLDKITSFVKDVY